MQERFEHSLFHEGFIKKTDRIICAVSGGADSLVMTHLFHASGVEIIVAHCNFQLRGNESDDDEKFVKAYCSRFNIPFYSKKFETTAIKQASKSSIQETARALRYDWFSELLSELNFDYISTGHNQSDNLESILINQIRGTGLQGMVGIPRRRDQIIRPLLDFKASEIRLFATNLGLEYRNDSSNQSDKYLRNQLRHNLVPTLLKIEPESEQIFSSNATKFNQYSELLNFFIDDVIQRHVEHKNGLIYIPFEPVISFPHPHILLSRILTNCGFNFSQIRDITTSQVTGKFIESPKYRVTTDRKYWIVEPRLNPKEVSIEISGPGLYEFKGHRISVKSVQTEDIKLPLLKSQCIIDSRVTHRHITVRSWQTQDRIRPFGMTGTKLVSDVFVDHKIAAPHKTSTPIFTHKGKIVWVGGLCFSEDYRINLLEHEKTSHLWMIQIDTD
ncbi:MAG: tRNA(Ile)-lysidine synthase [Bacteroidia bacterium]|jgi:tRNA(Ile)-lysidine synthase